MRVEPTAKVEPQVLDAPVQTDAIEHPRDQKSVRVQIIDDEFAPGTQCRVTTTCIWNTPPHPLCIPEKDGTYIHVDVSDFDGGQKTAKTGEPLFIDLEYAWGVPEDPADYDVWWTWDWMGTHNSPRKMVKNEWVDVKGTTRVIPPDRVTHVLEPLNSTRPVVGIR